MRPDRLWLTTLLVATFVAAPLAAADFGFRGWGPRLGLGDDPDQVIGGIQLDLGNFTPELRFQPNLELGLGDHRTIFSLSLPALYRFGADPDFTPYVGGGASVAYIDYDRDGRRRRDDSETEVAPFLAGGIEWPLRGGGNLFAELAVSGGDLPVFKLMLGWMRRPRP